MFKDRSYRQWIKNDDLVYFRVVEKETDLLISADKNLEKQARQAILNYRRDIESYIQSNKKFLTSLEPIDIIGDAPQIVKAMSAASEKAGVGPMASVAGAMAQTVGRFLLEFSAQIIVENGGDIFMKTSRPRTIGIYAGEKSPFTGKLALEIEPRDKEYGICTSSGTVSHSLSFGKADAVLIISNDAALSDAAATATGNIVKEASDIAAAIEFAKTIEGVSGILILIGDKLGSWGEIKLA
ncbi:MAG: UPF0280 family protein [Candidatus Omnitrophica bacterium]|nr:UPF0280 family protein [Candidatus Omnitrophota bacterium]